jgi:class 3 adenylate cyclase/pimeloyl-ACP methyl ester carboxylesterase
VTVDCDGLRARTHPSGGKDPSLGDVTGLRLLGASGQDSAMEFPQPSYAQTADGTHIAYSVLGDGPIDLVYAFGYLSNIDADGEVPFHANFRRRLASFSRLILFDRRGTGLSDRSMIGDAGSLEAGMDDIRAVMDAANSERALLFGLRDGAMLSALFAASHPDRVFGLVLWAPVARGSSSPDYPWAMSAAEWDDRLELVRSGWGSVEFAQREMRFVAPQTTMSGAVIEKAARMYRAAASPASAEAIMRTRSAYDLRAVLPAVQVPTLVMQATEDPWLEGGRHTAALIPGARFVPIPGSDLLPFWSAAEQTVEHVERFISRIKDEEAGLERVLSTVLFTDIVGATTKATDLGDRAWKQLLERHHLVIRAMLGRYRGSEVDTAGDAFFATFDGPARGVRCALAIRDALRPLGLEVRAGLHTGEVETINDKVGGIAVHIGARVGAIAQAGEILVSNTVKDLVVGSGLIFEDAGEYELKGIPDLWRLYRVLPDAALSTFEKADVH